MIPSPLPTYTVRTSIRQSQGHKSKKKKKKRIIYMQQKYSRMRRENSTIADLIAHNLCCGLQNFTSAMFFKSFHTFIRKLFFVYFYSLLFGPKVCFKESLSTFCINILQLYLLFERDFSLHSFMLPFAFSNNANNSDASFNM